MRALHVAMLPIIPVAMLLAGCHRNDAEHAPATPAATSTPAPVTATNEPAITMRYACGGDTSVEILGADAARAALPDGRVVSMTKVAGSMPPTFAGGSLYFAIGSNDAHLSQEDGTNELPCQAQ